MTEMAASGPCSGSPVGSGQLASWQRQIRSQAVTPRQLRLARGPHPWHLQESIFATHLTPAWCLQVGMTSLFVGPPICGEPEGRENAHVPKDQRAAHDSIGGRSRHETNMSDQCGTCHRGPVDIRSLLARASWKLSWRHGTG